MFIVIIFISYFVVCVLLIERRVGEGDRGLHMNPPPPSPRGMSPRRNPTPPPQAERLVYIIMFYFIFLGVNKLFHSQKPKLS